MRKNRQDQPDKIDFNEKLNGRATRRDFLRRASILSLAIPGAGAALTGCGKNSESRETEIAGGGKRLQEIPGEEPEEVVAHEAAAAVRSLVDPDSVKMERFDPKLPPLSDKRELNLDWRSQETPVRVSEKVVVAAWTFEKNLPGPIVHCKVGDTVNFTLTNDVAVPHSMDFHAAEIDPKTAFRSVLKEESVSFSFQPRRAGAFLYHCGTPPTLLHIGMGMFGAMIVSPEEPLPPAKEFVLIQNEFYLQEPIGGISQFDYSRMLSGSPQFVAFNGRPNQYLQEPMEVDAGDRVRFWVVNAGPTLPCAFHVIGQQFETVYLGEPPGNAIHGVQTFAVPAGGGMVFELDCDVPGEFSVVNHAMGHGQKGAMGHLVVRE